MVNPPIILNLSMLEAQLLEKFIDNFREIGYEIEEFGGQDFAVRGIPADFIYIRCKRGIDEPY